MNLSTSNRRPNYDKSPFVSVEGMDHQAWEEYGPIIEEIGRKIAQSDNRKTVLAVECYPGVNHEEVLSAFVELNPCYIFKADDFSFDGIQITSMMDRNLTDDRVFGVLSCHTLDEFFDPAKVSRLRDDINKIPEGIVIVYGTGATLLCHPDLIVYADLARWEIQQRFRRGELGNWKLDNYSEDILRKYKRAFFVEWRMADRHKKGLFDKIDYLLDTNRKNHPKMITGDALRKGLIEAAHRPFRVVPFFDPGVWGGQWMKEVCDLDRNVENFAWCFDCVPEENSLYLKYGRIQVEIPSINVVFYQPKALLGERVYARFGTEFPIRFDFLDTIDGQNLSLQVHPLTEYIQEKFGMHYTQDESYYLLDAKPDASVYLGFKEDIEKELMIEELEKAQAGKEIFQAEKFVNKFSAKKHDHFLIPAGTIHCSGKDSMILEISATPYIFTFKLWDWGRVGLDGIPRPIHLEHGKQVLQWDRTTSWVEKNLINRVEILNEGNGWIEERTGLHETEFIETRRHWFSKSVLHHTHGEVNVLNLIEGEEAIITSPNNCFEPFVIHYAETVILPAAIGEYIISPYGESREGKWGTIKAFVR
jgi:mannose-6-phosphate isomerase class I